MEDPGEDGVLGEIVVRAVGQDVHEVQVLHVGHLSVCPHRRHLRCLDLHPLFPFLLQVTPDALSRSLVH